jgi:hypothetical protein
VSVGPDWPVAPHGVNLMDENEYNAVASALFIGRTSSDKKRHATVGRIKRTLARDMAVS